MLDRWSITITDQKGEEEYSKGSKDNLNEEKRKMVSEKIPFNIINNYFSIGVVSNSAKSFSRFFMGENGMDGENMSLLLLLLLGRCHLLKVSPRTGKESAKVQQPYEEQIVVL